MGKGDSSIPYRKEFVDSLSNKYAVYIRNKGNKIKMNAYYNKLSGEYTFHLIMPSETERTNTYDVVFQFSDPKKEHNQELSISNYDVTVFSNSPSFAYTFAHVYAKNGLLINDLKSRFDKIIFRKEPVVRNRYNIVNYEKYVYFGARYIIDSKRLNRAFLDMIIKPYKKQHFVYSIRTLDTILKEYDIAESEVKKKRKKDSNKESRRSRTTGENKTVQPKSISMVKKVSPKKPTKPKKPSKVRRLT